MQAKTERFLNRLQRLQEKALLTQGEVLKKIRLSKAMLSFIRNGRHPPSVKVLRRLAMAELEVGIEAPVTGESTMGEIMVQEQRTGQPAEDFYRPDYRKKRMAQLREAIQCDREMLAMIGETLQKAEQELKHLESLDRIK